MPPANQSTVCADGAIAGNDDGHGIAPVGGAHGARSVRAIDLPGDFAVAARFSERDRQQRRPSVDLEVGAPEIKQNGKLVQHVFRFRRGGDGHVGVQPSSR